MNLVINILRAVRLLAYFALDSILYFFPTKCENRALIVRLDAIGDFAVWLQSGAADVIVELRNTHQELSIVANPAWAAFARDLSLFDNVFSVDPRRFMRSPAYRLKSLLLIKRWGARTVLMPRCAKVFLQEDEIVRVSRAEARIGVSAIPINTPSWLTRISQKIYTKIIPVPVELGLHESLRNAALAHAFCRRTGSAISISPISNKGTLKIGFPYFIVAPGAGSPGRQWPVSKFRELIKALTQETGWKCVIVGGGNDKDIAGEIAYQNEDFCIDLSGQQSLSAVVDLIHRARLLVANETGLMHIGSWLRTPTVGIVGGGHFGWFAPYPSDAASSNTLVIANNLMPCYGCNWQCSLPYRVGEAHPCVSLVEAGHVYRLAKGLIGGIPC